MPMAAWQVFLFVLVIILMIYLCLLLYVLISLMTFRGKIKRRIAAFRILLSEKRDLLLSLFAILDRAEPLAQSALNECCAKVRWLKCETIDVDEILKCGDLMDDLQNRLSYSSQERAKSPLSREFSDAVAMLNDINLNLRRQIALYNKDVAAYTYWRKFFLTRPVFALFRFRKYERLS